MEENINYETEHPLWKNYVEEMEKLNLAEQTKWMKEVEPPVDVPFAKKSFHIYDEIEFLEKLENDEVFNKKWGEIID